MNLFVKITGAYDGKASLDSAKKDIESLDDAADKATKGGVGNFKSALGDVAKVAGGFAIGAGLVALPGLVKGSIGAASDLEESISKVNVVFGDGADEVLKWSNNAATSLGMSKGAAIAATGTFGAFLTAMGQTPEEAQKLSMSMVQLSADMASFNNASPEETLLALRAGLSGEAEPLKKFGVALSDAAVKAKAAQLGLGGLKGELTEQEKIQARYAIIMEQTTTAQGDFARTADGNANQMRILKAQFADVSAEVGANLIPVVVALGGALVSAMPLIKAAFDVIFTAVGPLVDALTWVVEHAEKLTPVFAAVGAVIGTVLIGALVSSTVALYAQATAWLAVAAATIAANLPLIAIIATIALVVGAVVWLIQNWDMVVEKFPAIGVAVEKVKAAFQGLIDFATGKFLPAIKDAIGAIAPAIDAAKAVIGAAMSAVSAVISAHIEVIKGIFNALSALLRGDFGAAWNALKDTIFGAWQNIAGIVSDGIETIKGMAGKFGEAGTALGKGFLDALKAALLSTGQFAADIGSAVVEAVKAAVNSVIDSINRSLEFKIPVKGLPDIHVNPPDIPHLARGGITTGPTLAVVGDNPGGREAIIPLPADGMLGGGLVVNIYALDSDSVRRAIPEIARQLKVHARQTGFSLA